MTDHVESVQYHYDPNTSGDNTDPNTSGDNEPITFKGHHNHLGWKKLAAALAGVLLAGCSASAGDTPKPQPSPTATEPAPKTPSATPSVETTPSATPTPTPEATTAKVDVHPDIHPFRDWKIADGTYEQLSKASSDVDKWNILKQVVFDNNEAGSYDKDIVANRLVEPEKMAKRTMTELSTMADLGTDLTVQDGLSIATEWANAAIIDKDTRQHFINSITADRKFYEGLTDADPVEEIMSMRASAPLFHHEDTIYKISNEPQHFQDQQTGETYTGVTFTALTKSEKGYYAKGSVETFTTVFIWGAENATQILRVYPGDKGWKISYNTNEQSIDPTEGIPEIKDILGK